MTMLPVSSPGAAETLPSEFVQMGYESGPVMHAPMEMQTPVAQMQTPAMHHPQFTPHPYHSMAVQQPQPSRASSRLGDIGDSISDGAGNVWHTLTSMGSKLRFSRRSPPEVYGAAPQGFSLTAGHDLDNMSTEHLLRVAEAFEKQGRTDKAGEIYTAVVDRQTADQQRQVDFAAMRLQALASQDEVQTEQIESAVASQLRPQPRGVSSSAPIYANRSGAMMKPNSGTRQQVAATSAHTGMVPHRSGRNAQAARAQLMPTDLATAIADGNDPFVMPIRHDEPRDSAPRPTQEVDAPTARPSGKAASGSSAGASSAPRTASPVMQQLQEMYERDGRTMPNMLVPQSTTQATGRRTTVRRSMR